MIDKRLIFSLLPILVFLIGDFFFDPLISSLLAIGLLLVEIGFNKLRYKKIDLVLWIELGLLFMLTLVDYFTSKSIIYKELIYALALLLPFVIGNLLKKNIIFLMISRYFGNKKINSYQQYEIERSSNYLFILLTINFGLLAVIEVITLVRGQTFAVRYFSFIILGIGFLAMLWDKRVRNRKFSKESWVPIVSEEGVFEGSAPRSVVHDKSFILHPVVHLHLVYDGQIYLQKRPVTKKIQPGKWDSAVGGHVDLGEDITQALYRESFEELGIFVRDEVFLKRYVWTSGVEKELVFCYLCLWNDGVFPNELELDGGRFWSVQEIEEQRKGDVFTPNFLEEFNWLKHIVLNSRMEV